MQPRKRRFAVPYLGVKHFQLTGILINIVAQRISCPWTSDTLYCAQMPITQIDLIGPEERNGLEPSPCRHLSDYKASKELW